MPARKRKSDGSGSVARTSARSLGGHPGRSGRESLGTQRFGAVFAIQQIGSVRAANRPPASTNTYPTLAFRSRRASAGPHLSRVSAANRDRLGAHRCRARHDQQRHLRRNPGPGRLHLAGTPRIGAGALARLRRVAELDDARGFKPRIHLVDRARHQWAALGGHAVRLELRRRERRTHLVEAVRPFGSCAG